MHKLWLCANKLKLNADKTDFILFGAMSQQEKFNPFFLVNILGESLIPSDAIKNLGVWFDSDFSFTKHVKNVCKLCFIQMRDLRQIQQYLTRDAALTAANALVGSRLDYCNSLFRVYLLLTYASYNAFKTVWPELFVEPHVFFYTPLH